MSSIPIPPHLKIAESVTEDEYQKAKTQGKIVMLCAMSVGVIAAIPLILLFTIWIGLPVAGFSAVLTERIMNSILKEARKAKTHRIKQYKELKAFRERHGLQ